MAVLIDAIGEVLAGYADQTAFPVLRVAVIDKSPLLQRPSAEVGLCQFRSEEIGNGSGFRCDIHHKQDCSICAEHSGFPADHPGDPRRF